jgi:hypothetical protein
LRMRHRDNQMHSSQHQVVPTVQGTIRHVEMVPHFLSSVPHYLATVDHHLATVFEGKSIHLVMMIDREGSCRTTSKMASSCNSAFAVCLMATVLQSLCHEVK